MFFFFFNDTATTEIYTLSLHDALPILLHAHRPRRPVHARSSPGRLTGTRGVAAGLDRREAGARPRIGPRDRKSTRLNSSHPSISYAVFCLKKKTKRRRRTWRGCSRRIR